MAEGASNEASKTSFDLVISRFFSLKNQFSYDECSKLDLLDSELDLNSKNLNQFSSTLG